MHPKIDEWVHLLYVTLAISTIEAYAWEIGALARAYPERDLLALTQADLTRYLYDRRVVHKCGDAAIKRAVNAFRSFYHFALGTRSPAADIMAPMVKQKKQRTLTATQTFEIMLACDTSTPRGKRDLAIIALGLDTGLRESEICRLPLNRVDLENRRLTVVMKGGDEGEGAFSLETVAILSAWLAIRPAYARHGVDTFFVGVGGTKCGQPITPSGLRVIFRRVGAAAGLEKFSPHDLRRTFATLSHRNGAPTRVIQVAGRWDDIRQVVQYTQALEAKDIDPYSPVTGLLRPPYE